MNTSLPNSHSMLDHCVFMSLSVYTCSFPCWQVFVLYTAAVLHPHLSLWSEAKALTTDKGHNIPTSTTRYWFVRHVVWVFKSSSHHWCMCVCALWEISTRAIVSERSLCWPLCWVHAFVFYCSVDRLIKLRLFSFLFTYLKEVGYNSHLIAVSDLSWVNSIEKHVSIQMRKSGSLSGLSLHFCSLGL